MKLDDLKAKLLANPEVRREYEALEPEYALRSAIIRLRQKRGLSQTQVAERLGTVQSVVSRLEAGSFNPRMSTLQKLAEALEAEIVITPAGARLVELREQGRRDRPVRQAAGVTRRQPGTRATARSSRSRSPGRRR